MRRYKIVSRISLDGNAFAWPQMRTLTDPSGVNPIEVYAGNAHDEGKHASIEVCTDVSDWQRPTGFDCVACAVEAGLALMIEWEPIDTRELSRARARASVAARRGMWDRHEARLTCTCGDPNCASLDALKVVPA